MFGKLVNGNIQCVKLPLHINNKFVFTTDETIIRSQGYKEVVYTENDSTTKIPMWEESDLFITQVWVEADTVPMESRDTMSDE